MKTRYHTPLPLPRATFNLRKNRPMSNTTTVQIYRANQNFLLKPSSGVIHAYTLQCTVCTQSRRQHKPDESADQTERGSSRQTHTAPGRSRGSTFSGLAVFAVLTGTLAVDDGRCNVILGSHDTMEDRSFGEIGSRASMIVFVFSRLLTRFSCV